MISKSTWQRMEKGDPTVSMGAYAQALFVLGFGAPFGDLVDQRNDEQGLLLEVEHRTLNIQRRSPESSVQGSMLNVRCSTFGFSWGFRSVPIGSVSRSPGFPAFGTAWIGER